MSNHRTLTINLASIILAAGVALPASFGTSLAAEQPSPEDNALEAPRVTRSLSLIVGLAAVGVGVACEDAVKRFLAEKYGIEPAAGRSVEPAPRGDRHSR
jgi:hypothetical protein